MCYPLTLPELLPIALMTTDVQIIDRSAQPCPPSLATPTERSSSELSRGQRAGRPQGSHLMCVMNIQLCMHLFLPILTALTVAISCQLRFDPSEPSGGAELHCQKA
eukprot:scaffold201707_cov36-Prasinocladus_malaysianus.AAC.1